MEGKKRIILPYLDDLLFLIIGCEAYRRLARIVEHDMRCAGLAIYWEKSDGIPSQEQLHLGFIVDLSNVLFKVPIHRWEALHLLASSIIYSKGLRVQARKLASLVGTIISMKLAWGPITPLYTRNLYHILNNVLSLNCWVTISNEALDELYF